MTIDRSCTYTIGAYHFVNFIKLDEDTIEKVREWRNDPSVRRHMYNSNEISKEEHWNFIKSLPNKKDRSYWLVYLNNKPLGVINIVDINYEKRCGEIGYYLIPSEQDSGNGLDFLYIVYDFMFNSLGCENLYGRTEIHNTNALALNFYMGQESPEGIVTISGVDYIEFKYEKDAFLKALKYRNDTTRLVKFIKDIRMQLKLKYKSK